MGSSPGRGTYVLNPSARFLTIICPSDGTFRCRSRVGLVVHDTKPNKYSGSGVLVQIASTLDTGFIGLSL